MTALNEKITKDEKNLGTGYQIGHSFFCTNNSLVLVRRVRGISL